jgi:hypothetical protein
MDRCLNEAIAICFQSVKSYGRFSCYQSTRIESFSRTVIPVGAVVSLGFAIQALELKDPFCSIIEAFLATDTRISSSLYFCQIG